MPANSDKITDKSIENEEIKEKSLENVISETVLWEHDNHTAEGPDYYIHKDDYFYGDEHEHKVYIFWEGHKIWRNLHLTFLCTVDKSKVKISQNFVAFSEYMNFTSCSCASSDSRPIDFPLWMAQLSLSPIQAIYFALSWSKV